MSDREELAMLRTSIHDALADYQRALSEQRYVKQTCPADAPEQAAAAARVQDAAWRVEARRRSQTRRRLLRP